MFEKERDIRGRKGTEGCKGELKGKERTVESCRDAWERKGNKLRRWKGKKEKLSVTIGRERELYGKERKALRDCGNVRERKGNVTVSLEVKRGNGTLKRRKGRREKAV